MFAGYAVVGVAIALAGSAAISRRWKAALLRIGLGALGFMLGAAVMGLFSAAYVASVYDGSRFEPAQKARILGEVIATQMNWAALGVLPGILVGAALGWRSHRKARAG